MDVTYIWPSLVILFSSYLGYFETSFDTVVLFLVTRKNYVLAALRSKGLFTPNDSVTITVILMVGAVLMGTVMDRMGRIPILFVSVTFGTVTETPSVKRP